ncbi:sugar phosphate isomerase/epimerase [Algoriphagus halophytocola]|uniref:Sugar phosphate isomerase/epimerase n=1 Tax=Algoriphagus halophytocola TaxID=2991499 RepID=A0ABY6MG42_9BACT|nr:MULTISPECIES: sugar phosphate isomerase/epimerase [unclassified Algoriphagus]UZD22761.1 sugar phosphate isomerase/epimerase [Algoriphagus sp. TR-M5]WBL44026.1 sugar phosphate isomerase/epimerase [Algoriphagus sp. TR-M9]
MKKLNIIILTVLLSGIFPALVFAQQKGDALLQVPLGVQSYSFRNHWANGVESTLDIIQQMGFKELEGGAPRGMSAAEFVKLCKARGISIPSTGTGFEALEADPQKVADQVKALGAKYVMVAWLPHDGDFTKANADRAIKAFNEGGKVLAENGITFKYHVHGYEFQPYGDGTLFDYIVEHTDPKYVSFQMDVMWTHFGGADPVALLKKYGDRWVSLHLKDLRKGAPKDMTGLTGPENDVVLGTGELDIPGILRESNRIGIKHMFIEDESDEELENLPKSIAYLKSLTY